MTVQRSKVIHRRRADEVRTQLELLQTDDAMQPAPATVAANLRSAKVLLEQPRSYRRINDAWQFIHEANREMLRTQTPTKLSARSIELRAEIADPKISAWRRQAIGVLLDRFDASLVPVGSSDPTPEVSYLIEAVKIRDEGASNNYRRISIQKDYLGFLVTALTIALIPFSILVAKNIGDMRTLTPQSCSTSTRSNSPVPTTLKPAESTAVQTELAQAEAQAKSQAVPATSLAIQQCQDKLVGRPWLFWASLLAGALGAIASTLQRNFGSKVAERVPEVMAALAATVSRLVLGAIAGLTAYLALRSGIFAIANAQVVAVALLAAFSFGFSERIFTVGETPK